MSRAAGEHERRGALVTRVGLPRGTARSHEPLPGEHVAEKSDGGSCRLRGGSAGTCARMRERERENEKKRGETRLGAGDGERPYSARTEPAAGAHLQPPHAGLLGCD